MGSSRENDGKRTWDTEVRHPWNPVIKQCLVAIDLHMSAYLNTRSVFHLHQADFLRTYIAELKEWILSEERLKEEDGNFGR